ncbi:Uncharacterised protein [Vibrio cholerae]|nr:Uncharacterised protein [Vibrio cholerae]
MLQIKRILCRQLQFTLSLGHRLLNIFLCQQFLLSTLPRYALLV